MDTDKLNRELQIFRNHVKIARENIIHKLVRDIKFWKGKQKSNTTNARASKKVHSAEALMSHIRAQPASELAKAVIRFKPKSVGGGSGGELTVEQRALLRFHENKKLSPEIQALIRRFGLNSKMEMLDKFLKSKDQVKGKEGKGKKVRKTKEKIKKAGKVKEAEQESEDQGFCEPEAAAKEGSEESNDESDSASEGSEEEQEVGKFVKSPAKVVQKKEPKPKDLGKKPESKKRKLVKSPEDEDESEKCVQIQDSFFVTSSGQSYVATAPVIDKKQQELEEEEFSWKRTIKKKDILGNKEERPQKRPFSRDQEDLHPSWKAKQQQKGIKPFQGQRKRLDEDDPKSDLHPSWAAKQSQKGIKPFAGKKTVFDSDKPAESTAAEDLHPSWAAKQKQKGIKPFAGKKIVFDSEKPAESSKEDLHPSWAAKQKQKGIQAFQGKKTVFESTPASQPAAVPSDLHPSWAAKQKEKGIQAFQGKKITFDD